MRLQDEYVPADVQTVHADAQAVMEHCSTVDACAEYFEKMQQGLIRHKSVVDEIPKVAEDLINKFDGRTMSSCLGESFFEKCMHAEAKEDCPGSAFGTHFHCWRHLPRPLYCSSSPFLPFPIHLPHPAPTSVFFYV